MSSTSPQPETRNAPAAPQPSPVEREKSIPESGDSPISLRTTVICGAILIAAGFIVGYGGNQFSYSKLFRDHYVRSLPPGAEIKPPEPKKALAAYMARGKKIFDSKCVTCHGPEAKGSGMAYPSLVGSKWALGDTERFAMIVLNGLSGPTSNGQTYNNVMTPQGIGMSPEDLAGIMTYVRNNFGNKVGDVVSVEQARNAMKISAARKNAGQGMTAVELADYAKSLEGRVIKADDLVDPITLLPAAPAGGAAKPDAPAAPAKP